MSDIAKMIASAKTFGSGTYLRQGRGMLVLDALKFNSGHKGLSLIAEFVVESSVTDPAARDAKGQPELANAPGTAASQVFLFEGENKAMMLGKAKAFFEALEGTKDDPEFETKLEQACSPAQPLRGARVMWEGFPVTTKGTKKLITAIRYTHVEEQDLASGIAFIAAAQAPKAAAK